ASQAESCGFDPRHPLHSCLGLHKMTIRSSISRLSKSKNKFRLSGSFAELCESKWFCFALILSVCAGAVILPIAIGGLHGSGDLSVYCNFEVDEGSPGEARVATFYYPHWKATVNGKGKEVVKDEGGAIIIPLGAETSAVIVHWEGPFRNKVAVWVSVV